MGFCICLNLNYIYILCCMFPWRSPMARKGKGSPDLGAAYIPYFSYSRAQDALFFSPKWFRAFSCP